MSWGSAAAVLVGCGLFGVCAAAASVWLSLNDDPIGAILVGVLSVALLSATAWAVRVRPRLTADPRGILLRGLSGSRRVPWSGVRVGIAHTRRLGRDVATLELELDRTGETDENDLVVLGRFELGADPVDVLEQLQHIKDRSVTGWA